MIEILAVIGILFPVSIFTLWGLVAKMVAEKNVPLEIGAETGDYEWSIGFYITWVGGMLFSAILMIVYWIDMYQATVEIESAPWVFTVAMLYILCLLVWLARVHIKRIVKNEVFTTHNLSLAAAVFLAIFYGAYMLVSLHEEEEHWYHWLAFLLVIPPIFGFVSTWLLIKHRKLKNPEIFKGESIQDTPVSHGTAHFFNQLRPSFLTFSASVVDTSVSNSNKSV